MKNKRNYYRLLHVQMDAPESVIKSAHRTMMQTLRLHPDLGGDEWNASLLNEAREVLLNPVRRAQYDKKLSADGYTSYRPLDRSTVPDAAGGMPSRTTGHTTTGDCGRRESASSADTKHLFSECDTADICPFCHTRVLWKPQQQHPYSIPFRCTRCDSPLTKPADEQHVLGNDQRRINRSYFEFCARIWFSWPQDSGLEATVCDWSTLGCGIEVDAEVVNHQIVRVQSPGFDAIAMVRHSSRKSPDLYVYGLEFITVEIRLGAGSIYSSVA